MVDYNAAESIQPLPRNIYQFLNNVFAFLILSLCVGPFASALESETSKVTVFRQLSEAKSIHDLPEKFSEFLVDGKREVFSEILFESGMKKSDVEDYLKYLCPEPGKTAVEIMSRIEQYNSLQYDPLDKADPLYYHQINKIPMRFLIMPTRILRVILFYGNDSIPREVSVPLAIDHRGIIIVGYKEYENYKIKPEPRDVKSLDIIDILEEIRSQSQAVVPEHN